VYKLFNVKQTAEKVDVDLDFFAAVHPDDRAGLKLLLVNATCNGGKFTTQYRVQWQDGTLQVIQALKLQLAKWSMKTAVHFW
jgi:PAS fold